MTKPLNKHEHHEHAGAADSGESCFAEYMAVLDTQRGMLGELDALSQRQAMMLEAADMEPLLSLLDEREQLLDRVMQEARLAEQLRARWNAAQGAMPSERRDEVRRGQDAVRGLAAQISRRDDKDQARLRQRLEGVAAELASVATSRRAASAYGSGSVVRPLFRISRREHGDAQLRS